MRKFVLTLLFFVFSVFFVFWGMAQFSFASGTERILDAEKLEVFRGKKGTNDAVNVDLIVSPKQLSFGDVLYLGLRITNVSDNARIRVKNRLFYELFRLKKCTFRSPGTKTVFVWEAPEFKLISPPENMGYTPGTPMESFGDLEPSEESWSGLERLEFPSVHDWKHPFWQEMASLVKREPQKIELEVEYETYWKATSTYKTEIMLRDCSPKQWELLECWAQVPYEEYEMTPETRINLLRRRLYLGIEAGGRHWQYATIRGGLSKPSPEGLPKTVVGWKRLEEMLAEGTLRDEITFTRMFLEYLETCATMKTETEWEKELQPMNEWLQKLPQIQRYAMLRQFSRKADVGYYLPPLEYLKEEEAEFEKRMEIDLIPARAFYRFFVPFNPPSWEKRLKKKEQEKES
ncbi:MAG: hypothetical protein Q4C70_06775 [Planctomycetia bacterium]|nr:hypothetical protein [Planctomycetia bacterium]